MPTQDSLRSFYDRRHPEYAGHVTHWSFLADAYRGGREWFKANIFRYHKEGDDEYNQRLERAYRFNHTREVVHLVAKYLFKAPVARNIDSAPEPVKEFWKRATLSGLDIDQIMRTASSESSVGGRIAIVVDNNLAVESDAEGRAKQLSVAEQREQNSRIYVYTVGPEDILDYAWDEEGDGGLLWIKLRERVRRDADPIEDDGLVRERTRLWTRNEWVLFEELEVQVTRRNKGKSEKVRQVEEVDRQAHGLGEVPVVLLDHMIGDYPYYVPSLIDDIAYLDRAATNYLSNLDAIIQDQTFSQLAIPAQAIPAGDDMYAKVLELGTKRVFVFDGGAGSTARPEFLSPDPKQAGVILSVINKIINEIYHTIGLAGERTKEDNAVGIDNSSGVAKAYDFERVNALLLSKAAGCQRAENRIVHLVSKWAGIKPPTDDLVTYPVTFDVMRLADELVTAEALGRLLAPAEVRREQMRQLVDKIFPQLKQDLKEKIGKSIEGWLTDDDPSFTPPTSFGSDAAPSRQGQVTKDTPEKKAA